MTRIRILLSRSEILFANGEPATMGAMTTRRRHRRRAWSFVPKFCSGMLRSFKRIVSLIVAISTVELHGGDLLANPAIGKNYKWDEYFRGAEVTIAGVHHLRVPCDPVVDNSGSLSSSNQIASLKVPTYRVIEIVDDNGSAPETVGYLMKRLESDIQLSDLPIEHRRTVWHAFVDLVSKGCFEAALLPSGEPIDSYVSIHHARGTTVSLSYATEEGFVFFTGHVIYLNVDHPAQPAPPEIEFEEPELEVPVGSLPDPLLN